MGVFKESVSRIADNLSTMLRAIQVLHVEITGSVVGDCLRKVLSDTATMLGGLPLSEH